MDLILPYKIGDITESKSFEKGYRGAWFRSKINDMRVTESGHFECYLEYIDYPAEDKEWIRLFQKNPACSKQQSSDQIMIRPSFPPWHWKDKVPEQFPNDDVVAIVLDETWKVGDMVDWFSEGCYWSGKITKLLNEDMLEVELLKPPIGEGQCYAANRKDLRPTLDWSLAGGWTVPRSQAEGKSWFAVHVVHRESTDSETSDFEEEISPDDGGKDDNGGDGDDNQDLQLQVIFSNSSQKASGDKGDNGGDGDDSQDLQLQVIPSNLSQKASGDKDNNGGDGDDSQDLQLQVILSNSSQKASGDKGDNGGDGDDNQDLQLQVIPSNSSQKASGDKDDNGGDGDDGQDLQLQVIPSNSSQKASGDKDENGGDGDHSQDLQLQVIPSNSSQKGFGSPIPKPSSAAKSISSLNAQDDATLTSMADLEPSSSSKSQAPSDTVQPAVTSSQPGIGIIEQEGEIEQEQVPAVTKLEQTLDVLRQFQQRLAKVDAKHEDLMERKRSIDRRAAGLSSVRWVLDDVSAKTK